MAHPGHTEVRSRYRRSCGYCGITETDAGGEHTVDHYRPVSAGGDDGDDNLVYCCFRCNTYKGDFWPTPEDLENRRRILHPLLDPVSSHLREDDQIGELVPLTDTGRFHLLMLRLNRPPLVEYRRQRRLLRLMMERHQVLQAENEGLRRRIDLLERYLEMLTMPSMEEEDEDHQGP